MERVFQLALALISLSLIGSTGALNVPENGKLWAVLVAGSAGYYNYRHQADICHAYQILHKHGIPDEQIIVMMYDDIAFSDENPTPGIIVNHPNGSNVYLNVPKDYTGAHVTPKNFLNVLLGKGDEMAGIGSGKVIKSGPNDHIFVNFADHGAPGLLAFPMGELYVTDFLLTLKTMSKNKSFQKMVLYIEACESGSMFPKASFPNNISIFATTAANAKESSFACYYDDERQTFLGDLYSVNWMEDSDSEDIETETLANQYKIVKTETNASHVQEFGDVSIANMKVGDFQGGVPTSFRQKLPKVPFDAVPAPEVPIRILKRKFKAMRTNSKESVELQRQINKVHSNRIYLDKIVYEIIQRSVESDEQINFIMSEHLDLNNLSCYERVAKYFSKNCFSLSKNDYALRQMYKFVNLCEMKIKARTIEKAMDMTCVHPPIYGIH